MHLKVCKHRECPKSGEGQALENFNREKGRPDGLAPYCRTCRSRLAARRNQTREAKEKNRQAQARYRNSEKGKKRIRDRYLSREGRDTLNRYAREWTKRPETRLKLALKQGQYRLRNTLKEKARHAVGYALRAGRLVRPTECEWCGVPGDLLEAHHWRGYDPAHWLDVRFVHPACHDACEAIPPEAWPPRA